MKKLFVLYFACLSLSACALFHHSPGNDSDTTPMGNEPIANTPSLINQQQPSLEAELSKLKTRLEAMETKLDVISNSLERRQMQQSQPEIHADLSPQSTMAAPVEEAEVAMDTPAIPTAKPEVNNSNLEQDFKSAMTLFQNGHNLEAARKFTDTARKNPKHLLASHALYWSGEASARIQQWTNAMESWEQIEKNYPQSAHLPETLAGLAKANEAQGNLTKSKAYKALLSKAFPNSPAALSVNHQQQEPQNIGDEPASAEKD